MSGVLLVHVVLALFNFLASIVQGIASFGDAVLLQVLWFIVCTAYPDPFNQTPLGNEPVKVVALLMYARVMFSAPYMAYLCLQSGGLFSKSMCLYMAIPSTTTAVIGVYVFSKADGGSLTLFLGISSLIFAVLFTGILGYRYYKQRSVRAQIASGASAAAITPSAAAAEGATAVDVHSGSARPPSSASPRTHRATDLTVVNEFDLVANELAASRNASFAGAPPPGSGLPGAPDNESASDDDDMRTVMSTTTGDIFTRREARTPVINEEGGPTPLPLTHERLSPTETMTYTRVQINRNLDENGKIKRSTKIAAAFAAAGSGIMGSLTGVGAPPQVVFVLWFEVPQYIIRVNFAIQSIPSAVFRFFIAIYKPLFTWAMVPYLINGVVSGYVGVFVGNKLGKLLGPNAFNVFVLVILLLSSLLMVTENTVVLTLCTIAGFVVSGVMTWYERKTLLPKVEQQRAAEREMYANRAGAVTGHSHTVGADAGAGGDSTVVGNTASTSSMNGQPVPATRSHTINKSTSLTTVDSEVNSLDAGKRTRKAEKFRPPSLFSTPNGSPVPSSAPSKSAAWTTTAAATVSAASSSSPPAEGRTSSASVPMKEDKPHQPDDEELV